MNKLPETLIYGVLVFGVEVMMIKYGYHIYKRNICIGEQIPNLRSLIILMGIHKGP